MFRADDILDLSGLTRGQLDQLISRYHVEPEGPTVGRGGTRYFTKSDAFRYSVCGRLLAIGIDSKSAAKAVMWFDRLQPDGSEPETFPGHAESIAERCDRYVVVRAVDGNLDANFVTAEQALNLSREGAFVLNASALARRIDKAAQGAK